MSLITIQLRRGGRQLLCLPPAQHLAAGHDRFGAPRATKVGSQGPTLYCVQDRAAQEQAVHAAQLPFIEWHAVGTIRVFGSLPVTTATRFAVHLIQANKL